MNIEERIEQYLRAAPKPPVPDDLMNRLRQDVILREVKTRQSTLRRLFAPSGERISLWRIAAAAITIAVLLPLSYGATRLIKRFIAISQLPAVNVDFVSNTSALSPDGKYLAGVAGDSQLVILDTSTGEKRKIAENCQGPAVWSADGSEIAVTKRGGGGGTLLAVSLKTGGTRSLMENPPYFWDWASDAKFILAVTTSKTAVRSVIVVNLENKERTVLAEDTRVWPFPRFSPKGDRVSYVTEQDGRSILHLQRIDGTSHVEYSDFPGDIGISLWSPDGSHIVFTGKQRGTHRQYTDLWALRIAGDRFAGPFFPVVPDVEQMEFYNWSQNGQLAYRTSFDLGGIFTLPVDPQTGKAVGSPRQLVRRGGLGSHCWSPDGKQIALLDGSELSLISASSGENVRSLSLSKIQYIGRGMSWSPDGRLVAFCGRDPAMGTGIFLVSVETGAVRLLAPLTGLPNFDPTWAPDSKTVCYSYKYDIYIADIEGGKPRRVTPPSENQKSKSAVRPVFAPDGKSVTYLAGFEGVFGERILGTTIDGQETRQIFMWRDKKSGINIFDLSPDSRHIVFTPGNKDIWCAPTDVGEPFELGDVSNVGSNAWAWMPKWSPKGDAIAFIVTCEEHHYWVMENFLLAGTGVKELK